MQLSRTPFFVTTLVLSVLTPTLFAQDDPAYVKPDDSKDTPAEREQEEAPIIQQDDSGTIEGFGETWRGLKRLERIQFLSNIETIRA